MYCRKNPEVHNGAGGKYRPSWSKSDLSAHQSTKGTQVSREGHERLALVPVVKDRWSISYLCISSTGLAWRRYQGSWPKSASSRLCLPSRSSFSGGGCCFSAVKLEDVAPIAFLHVCSPFPPPSELPQAFQIHPSLAPPLLSHFLTLTLVSWLQQGLKRLQFISTRGVDGGLI